MTRHIFPLFLAITATAMLTSCDKFIYGVDMLNYGEHGVLVLQVGDLKADRADQAYFDLGVNVPIVAGRLPRLPLKYRDPASYFGRFSGYERSLPKGVTIAWQLAELMDCKTVHRVNADSQSIREALRGHSYNRIEYVRKSGCTWRPIPNKIFRRTLDMNAIRNSDAYKRTGAHSEEIYGSLYTLNLTLIFIEDQVNVELENSATNPWL